MTAVPSPVAVESVRDPSDFQFSADSGASFFNAESRRPAQPRGRVVAAQNSTLAQQLASAEVSKYPLQHAGWTA